MKKHIILLFTAILLISSIGVSQRIDNTTLDAQADMADFTHTVFAEYATTTWCPSCPAAAQAIYDVFNNATNPFYYVTLISDVNPNAQDRVWYGYFDIVVPSVYFDGGKTFYFGNAGSVDSTISVYSNMVEEMGMRSDVKDIDLETSVSWNGDAKMTIDVTITNNENSYYLGFIKSYVTEINSRWNDQSGKAYHYAFLDFAINKFVSLKPQETKIITVQWDGTEDHNGITFGDITQDNILVQSAIFQWVPHFTKGYDELPARTQYFLGFHLDEASAAVPE
jgi:hypothetical protein